MSFSFKIKPWGLGFPHARNAEMAGKGSIERKTRKRRRRWINWPIRDRGKDVSLTQRNTERKTQTRQEIQI